MKVFKGQSDKIQKVQELFKNDIDYDPRIFSASNRLFFADEREWDAEEFQKIVKEKALKDPFFIVVKVNKKRLKKIEKIMGNKSNEDYDRDLVKALWLGTGWAVLIITTLSFIKDTWFPHQAISSWLVQAICSIF